MVATQHMVNLLLNSLPAEEFDRLRPLLRPLLLVRNAVIRRAGEESDRLIFPCGGIISSLVTMHSGDSVEIWTAGQEGVVGVMGFFATRSPPFEVVSSIGGPAFAASIPEFRAALRNAPVMLAYLQAYTQALFAQVGQRAACNACHSVEARCAFRLMAFRRYGDSNVLPVTQEMIARLLGVRRPGVTAVALGFQRMGLISQARGQITIIDPAGLEKMACECLPTLREIYQHLPWMRPDLEQFPRAPVLARNNAVQHGTVR